MTEDAAEASVDDRAPGASGRSGDDARSERDTGAAPSEPSDGIDRTAEDRDADGAAASFVDVEREMQSPPGEERTWGRAVDVDRVPIAAVPDNYPELIRSETALALTVAVEGDDDRTAVLYFEWPGDGSAERLERLLSLLGIEPEQFADLHGKAIGLRRTHRHVTAAVPDEDLRGRRLGVGGILASVAVTVGVYGIEPLSPPGFLVPLVFLGLFVLPLATYLDAWYLRTRTDWDSTPAGWAVLMLLPGLNLVAALGYLWTRSRTTTLLPGG
ncbi:hypothetical protein [Halomicrobium salinisoli]|uniref:hypothetical protein n=1 Tax=Halomicrobium salinisoli TaxID=2878391 RepID=UPI001CF0BE36|nr:hypothetical protein [Halomicrobium salinisoli]